MPPLEIPRDWLGVDKIVNQVETVRDRKPRFKNVFFSENKKRVKKRVKARWVFPHIQATKAWTIAKHVLGEKYYPHFLRLNRLTDICSDPTASLTRLKSFSGIKSTRVIDGYLGTSKKEQKKAFEFMEKQMS